MNPKEWPNIVRQFSPLVWQSIYRLLANKADAADCFQETFVSAWELASRQPVKNWVGLLQHLATTRALDHLRRRRSRMRHLTLSSDLSELPGAANGPLEQAQLGELAIRLREGLAELPVQQSEIYCLRHLNGLSYEQIAEELGISVSTVGVNLHRATQRLRAILAPMVIDERNATGEL